MSYFRINTSVAVNVNFVTLEGIPVTGLTDATISLILLKAGITQSIAGLYTISPQQRGIYRVVFNSSIMTDADVDYVLIAQDTTEQALDDKVEFTLYDETIDSVYSKLKTEIDVNENLLNVINAGTDEVESLLKNATYGLSAAKILQDNYYSNLSSSVTTVQNEVVIQANQNEIKIDALTNNVALIIPEINNNENKLDILISYTDTVETLLNNATYGLSSLKNKLNDLESQHSTNTSTIVNEVISQANQNEAKIDTIMSTQGTDISDILTQIGVANNKLNVVESYTDEVESLLKSTTYGLSKLKDILDIIQGSQAANTSTIVNEVISQANQNEAKIDILTSDVSSIIPEINNNENKLDVLTSYIDEVESLLKNTTHGLEAIKILQDAYYSNLSNSVSTVQAEVISQANENETKIDTLTNNVALIIPEINNNENKIDIVTSYVDEVEPLLKNASYGLSILKATLVDLQTQGSLNTSIITAEVISQANQNEYKLDILTSNLSTVEGNITSQISSIPTNPLLTNDSRVSKLNYLDTTSSQLPTLAAQQTWAYPARYLTGTSGVNQIDVAGFNTAFLINQNAFVNITLRDSSTNAFVTGRTYPNNIGVEFWKGGILTDTSANIAIQETATGVYRTTINAALINVPAIDYLLVVSDTSAVAAPQIVEFTAFEIIGVADPKVVTIKTIDSFTLLPIPDTQVYVRNMENNLTINKGLTANNGNYTTGLTDGTYSVILRKGFTDFTVPETLVVNNDTTAVFYGLTFSPSLPVQPNTAVLYGTVIDISGNKIKNAKITITEPQSDRFSGTSKVAKLSKSVMSDNNGAWEIELAWSSTLSPAGIPYKIDITFAGFSYSNSNILIHDVSSVEFSTLI